MKAVLDPNVLVSAAISPRGVPAQIVDAWSDERFELVISPAVPAELREVLLRPSLRRWVTPEEAVEYVEGLEDDADLVPDPADVPAISRDPKDDYLIALARSAGADCIVSGDQDLSGLTELQPPVLTRAPSWRFCAAEPTVRRRVQRRKTLRVRGCCTKPA